MTAYFANVCAELRSDRRLHVTFGDTRPALPPDTRAKENDE
jgi:hypothetical protein